MTSAYQIKPLHKDYLAQLQTAIIEGALEGRFATLRTSLSVNKDNDNFVREIEGYMEDLRYAARAIMEAAPFGSPVEQFTEVAKRETMGELVLMSRSDYATLQAVAADLRAPRDLSRDDCLDLSRQLGEALMRTLCVNWNGLPVQQA